MEAKKKRSVEDYVASLPSSCPKSSHREIVLKLLIIGDSMVGKTSLVQRYVNNVFVHSYKETIGVDFTLKILQWSDDLTIKVQLWDIAGMERFSSVTRAYYRNANGCLLMFDLADLPSFNRVQRWKEDLDSKCRLSDGSTVPCLLLGNKSDLPQWKVTRDEIHRTSLAYSFTAWREISVKENVGVDEALQFLIQQMLTQTRRAETPPKVAAQYTPERDTVIVRLSEPTPTKPKPSNDDCSC